MTIPKPVEILEKPLGNGSIRIGMTKEQVIAQYGDADIKNMVISDDWSRAREEWVYTGRYTMLPVSAGYLSKDLYLYFDGENLTNISEKSLGKTENSD